MVHRRKKPAKGITLPEEVWIKKTKVKGERDRLLEEQEYVCDISGVTLSTGVLDHDHESGNIRGVLLNEVNMLEGRYLKLFNKLKLGEKYGFSFPEMLVSMGEYLQKDYSDSKLHYGLMEDKRRQTNRLTKPALKSKLLKDFGIESDEDKKELVRLYIQAWVDEITKEINNE